MLLFEFIELLRAKSKRRITFAEIGRALILSRSNISLRIKNKSEITLSEVKKIQDYIGINIFVRIDGTKHISSHTFERIKNDDVLKNYNFIGFKLTIIQDKLDYLDKDMAKILNMSEERYVHIKIGKIELTIKDIFRLISRVDVSLDWFFKVPIDVA